MKNDDGVQWHMIGAAAAIVSVQLAYTGLVKNSLDEKDSIIRSDVHERLSIREHEAFKIYVEREIATMRDEITRLRNVSSLSRPP